MKKWQTKIVAVAAAALLLVASSCSTAGGGFDICSAVSIVETQQTTVQVVASYMISMGSALPPDVMLKTKAAYTAWYTAQALIVQTLIVINDSGGNPAAITVQQYTQLLVETAALAATLIALYNSTKAPALNQGLMARATATGCVMTDQQIHDQLVPKSWTELGGL